MNEKIKEIAEFDGYGDSSNTCATFYADGTYSIRTTPNYLTDLNALHRVALDVLDILEDSLLDIDYSAEKSGAIYDAFRSRPINGQYTELVDAVYEAIVYLKQHNQCQPK